MASTTNTQASGEEKQYQQYQVPEWEHNLASQEDGASKPRTSTKAALSKKFDSIFPPHRKYIALSRKAFLWTLLAIFLALLALIIGLAAGLSSKSGPQNLPLPSNTAHFTGDLTYFQTGLGACGETNDQNDLIVSISHYVFDAAGSSSDTGGNSNANPLCGLMVRASRYDESVGAQRSVDLKVADRCTGCQPEDLDTTVGAFEKLAAVDLGRVDVTWAWLEPMATGK